MLITGVVLVVLASIIGGWRFMCDARPIVDRPKLGMSPIPFLIAALIAFVGVIFLIIFKWYAGLLGIGASIVGFILFAVIWDAIYRFFRL
jgi:hypothetical protein